MGVRKIQGADALEFQLQMTVAGLESANLSEECLQNEAGRNIVKVKCWGGRLSAYINLPHAIRPNNAHPFMLSDCIKLELVKSQVIEFMQLYLRKHLGEKYTDEFLLQMKVTKMECNLTVQCLEGCKPKDIIVLFERAFPKVTLYKATDDRRSPHRKPERGVTASKEKEWVLKVYDKSYSLRKAGDLNIEPNLVRVELVYLDRMLNRMYSGKRSLADILTRRSIKRLIDQYQETFDEICRVQLKTVLDNCVQEVFESLTYSKSGHEVKDTVARCKEYLLDIEVLRKALQRWYRKQHMPDYSRRIISYYRKGEFGIPEGVLKTVKLMHDSTGEKGGRK